MTMVNSGLKGLRVDTWRNYVQLIFFQSSNLPLEKVSDSRLLVKSDFLLRDSKWSLCLFIYELQAVAITLNICVSYLKKICIGGLANALSPLK